MGYGKRKRSYKKRSYRPRKKYKVSVSKLRDKKINTLFEVRAKAIAKAEIAKSIVKLYDRRYHFGKVDPYANSVTGGIRLFYDGIVRRVAEIDKVDINQPLNNPDSDPTDAKMQEEVDADGAVQGMPTEVSHGKRLTELIKIDGFSVHIKAAMDRCPDEFDHNAVGPNAVGNAAWHAWFIRRPNGELFYQLPETIIVKWSLVRVYDDQSQLAPIIQSIPSVESMLPYRRWGYNSALDLDLANETLLLKKRVLCKGSFSFRAYNNKEITIKKYCHFKNPLTVKYLPEDQNGQQTVSSRFFFVMRSNVPQQTLTQLLDYSPFAPRINLMVQTHYHE